MLLEASYWGVRAPHRSLRCRDLCDDNSITLEAMSRPPAGEARLDTCVSVIDEAESSQPGQHGRLPKVKRRDHTELLMEQVEFSSNM